MIVDKIKILCDERKISIFYLEQQCGLSHSISRWNNNFPSIEKVQKVADYFNVSIDYLLDRVESINQISIASRKLMEIDKSNEKTENKLEKIFYLMKQNNLNARQLEKKVGLSSGTVQGWKNNKYKPSLEAIVKIANYFDVSLDYLVGIEKKKQHIKLQCNIIKTISRDGKKFEMELEDKEMQIIMQLLLLFNNKT